MSDSKLSPLKPTHLKLADSDIKKSDIKKSPLTIIFITVFIDLIGFGIIIPLSPYLARQFNASAVEIGWLMAIYSLMQFLFSPFWGSLSDRIGRRPVLLTCLLGGLGSYLIFAFASNFTVLFVARAFAGVFGGNISTAHAYIADVTTKENRSKGMGLLGAAFGLGFIFGPLMGGFLSILGEQISHAPPFGKSFSSLGAAALCLGNFIFAFFKLPESLKAESRSLPKDKAASTGRMKKIIRELRRPISGELMIIFFLSGLAMAQMESMLFPYMFDHFGWGMEKASYGFAYVGVLMVLTQGYFVRKWMPKLGETKTLMIGLFLFAISLTGVALSQTIFFMGVVMTVLAVGNGLMRPPNLGMISQVTPAEDQGLVMGVANSLASLGRILGPLIGGFFYEKIAPNSVFFLASTLAFMAFGILILIKNKIKLTSERS